MKKLWCISLLCLSVPVFGQDWREDYQVAVSQAKTEQKPLVLVFSGSDWCAPCIKLDRQIWSSEAFIDYSTEHFVIYRADFPRKKKNQLPQHVQDQNRILAEKFNPKGYFPLVLVLDQEEQILGTTGYSDISASEYLETLKSFLR